MPRLPSYPSCAAPVSIFVFALRARETGDVVRKGKRHAVARQNTVALAAQAPEACGLLVVSEMHGRVVRYLALDNLERDWIADWYFAMAK